MYKQTPVTDMLQVETNNSQRLIKHNVSGWCATIQTEFNTFLINDMIL